MLAPAFDLTPATYPLASGFRAARVMGKAMNVSRSDLRRLGNGQGVRNVDRVIDEVLQAVEDWDRHARDHGLSKAITSAVARQHGLAD